MWCGRTPCITSERDCFVWDRNRKAQNPGERQHVPGLEVLRADALLRAVPQHRHHRLCQQGQPLDLPLGLDLLHDAHDSVDEDDEQEQDIFSRAHSSQRDGDHQVQQIEHSTDVVPQDLRDGFGGHCSWKFLLSFAFSLLIRRRSEKVGGMGSFFLPPLLVHSIICSGRKYRTAAQRQNFILCIGKMQQNARNMVKIGAFYRISYDDKPSVPVL